MSIPGRGLTAEARIATANAPLVSPASGAM